MTYFDKILYLYPNIREISYQHSQIDGTPWDDPYDGLIWENKDIPKPSKQTLDAVDENVILQKKNTDAEQRKIQEIKDNPIFKILLAQEKKRDGTATSDKLIENVDLTAIATPELVIPR